MLLNQRRPNVYAFVILSEKNMSLMPCTLFEEYITSEYIFGIFQAAAILEHQFLRIDLSSQSNNAAANTTRHSYTRGQTGVTMNL